MLGPAADGRLDLRVAQLVGHLRRHVGQVGVAAGLALADEPDDLLVALRVQRGEREVLELPLDRVHAEPVGQRRVDLERLAGLALLLVRRQEAQRAHVVQPVGELDDEHPRVARHRDDHLADGLALRGARGLRGVGALGRLDLVELGDPVDDDPDQLAELAGQPLETDLGVLDRVVQQRGGQGRGVHAEIGEDAGDGQRMGDVRIAGAPHLALVGLLGELVGPLDQADFGLGMGGAQARAGSARRRPATTDGPE